MIDLRTAKKYGNLLNLNFKVIKPKIWQYAMNVELEHGRKINISNVTNDNLGMTAKIALAHIIEYPDYYERLYIMEKEADQYWGDKKPNIFKS